MRKIIFVLVFMIGICLSGESKESGIKLIPVYEKTFEDTIVDVIFDTVTVSLSEAKAMGWKEEAFSEEEKAKGKVTITYPCVLITKEEIRFLDERGKEKKSINRIVKGVKWEGKQGVKVGEGVIKVRKSKGGEYLGVVIPREGSLLGEGIKGDFVMYRKNGKEMWKLGDVYLSDGYVIPSPNGEYAIALPPGEYPEQAPLYYSREGTKELIPREWQGKWKWPFFPETPHFSGDGKYFGIPITSYDGDSNFLLISTSFEQLWLKTLEGEINAVEISNTAKYFVVSSGNTTVCFNKRGKILWKRKANPSIFSFNRGEDLLLLVYSLRGKIESVDPATGIINWAFEDKALIKKSILIEVDVQSSTILMFGKLWQYLPPKGSECLYILSIEGKLLFKAFLESNLLTKTYFISEGDNKGINLSQDGKFITFTPYTGEIRIMKNSLIGGER